MLTSTLSLAWSALISLIVPLKSANGPGDDPHDVALLEPEAGTCGSDLLLLHRRIFSTSCLDSGVGLVPVPAETNPVTPGVFRTTYQESLS